MLRMKPDCDCADANHGKPRRLDCSQRSRVSPASTHKPPLSPVLPRVRCAASPLLDTAWPRPRSACPSAESARHCRHLLDQRHQCQLVARRNRRSHHLANDSVEHLGAVACALHHPAYRIHHHGSHSHRVSRDCNRFRSRCRSGLRCWTATAVADRGREPRQLLGIIAIVLRFTARDRPYLARIRYPYLMSQVPQ